MINILFLSLVFVSACKGTKKKIYMQIKYTKVDIYEAFSSK